MPYRIPSIAALVDVLKRLRGAGPRRLVCLDGTGASRKSTIARHLAEEPALLAGGNPQIAKGEGDAPVQAITELQAALAGRQQS